MFAIINNEGFISVKSLSDTKSEAKTKFLIHRRHGHLNVNEVFKLWDEFTEKGYRVAEVELVEKESSDQLKYVEREVLRRIISESFASTGDFKEGHEEAMKLDELDSELKQFDKDEIFKSMISLEDKGCIKRSGVTGETLADICYIPNIKNHHVVSIAVDINLR